MIISRGCIWDVPETKIKFVVTMKILGILHRLHFPVQILLLSINFILLRKLEFVFILYSLLFIEIFYFSIAIHEAIHISFAEFIDIRPKFMTFIPYSFGVRVHFNQDEKISAQDMACILFAGPGVSLFISSLLLIIYVFNGSTILLLCILDFSILNIMSFIPCRGSDGFGVAKVIKENGLSFVYVMLSAILVYILYSIGFKPLKKYIKKRGD